MTPVEFVSRLNTFETAAVPAALNQALVEAVAVVQGSIQLAAGKDAGKRITRTSARFSSLGGDPIAYVKATSRKAHLLDHDTAAHSFGPRRRGGLFWPGAGHPFLGTVTTPGTKGTGYFEAGVELANASLGGIFSSAIGNAMAKSFL